MKGRDLLRKDASEFERSSLEYILEKERRSQDTTRYLSVEEAINDDAVYVAKSSRDITRVLFISRDESLLNPTQQSLDGYINIADLFDEVHILILRQGIPTKAPVIRVADNVWLYTATDKNWWGTPLAGKKLAESQLVFAEGFRPDLIVARDAFESALLAIMLGKEYGRPVQVHVLEDYTAPNFTMHDKANRWRRYLARYTIPRVKSVRTTTRLVAEMLSKKFKIFDLALLPKFNNYESLIKQTSTLDLRQKYQPFVFIMLYIGQLDYKSKFYRAMDSARFGLRNPHLGMLVLGHGEAEREYRKRAEILEIKNQVVFETGPLDTVPYLKSANVLIVPDTDPESEEIVLQGAAAGIPMIMARTPAREDVFMDGESAFLCDPESTDEFSLKLNILMNDVPLRKLMAESAQDMIKSKFHEDPELYKALYRESIEEVLFLNDKPKTDK
ncbi:MAG: glycosyltransferase [Candidatus Paceibacterota bacterium]